MKIIRKQKQDGGIEFKELNIRDTFRISKDLNGWIYLRVSMPINKQNNSYNAVNLDTGLLTIYKSDDIVYRCLLIAKEE